MRITGRAASLLLVVFTLANRCGNWFVWVHQKWLLPIAGDVHRLTYDETEIFSQSNHMRSLLIKSNFTKIDGYDGNNRQIPKIISNGTISFKEQQVPLQTNQVIVAMIALGNTTKQNHVQRCIRSLRARGEWTGRIIIITDNTEAYHHLMQSDTAVHTILPRYEDWDGSVEYKEIKLKYKRFKTLLIDYIQGDRWTNFGDGISHIIYLDVDIIVCKPILTWINEKWGEDIAKREAVPDGLSIVNMFKEGSNAGKVAHSGVILLHVDRSRGCMEEWRRRMDRVREGRDQKILREMMRRGSDKTKCKILTWERKELIFPFKDDFLKRRFEQFVHITNTYHSKQTDTEIQREFLEEALNLTLEERQDPYSLAIVPSGF